MLLVILALHLLVLSTDSKESSADSDKSLCDVKDQGLTGHSLLADVFRSDLDPLQRMSSGITVASKLLGAIPKVGPLISATIDVINPTFTPPSKEFQCLGEIRDQLTQSTRQILNKIGQLEDNIIGVLNARDYYDEIKDKITILNDLHELVYSKNGIAHMEMFNNTCSAPVGGILPISVSFHSIFMTRCGDIKLKMLRSNGSMQEEDKFSSNKTNDLARYKRGVDTDDCLIANYMKKKSDQPYLAAKHIIDVAIGRALDILHLATVCTNVINFGRGNDSIFDLYNKIDSHVRPVLSFLKSYIFAKEEKALKDIVKAAIDAPAKGFIGGSGLHNLYLPDHKYYILESATITIKEIKMFRCDSPWCSNFTVKFRNSTHGVITMQVFKNGQPESIKANMDKLSSKEAVDKLKVIADKHRPDPCDIFSANNTVPQQYGLDFVRNFTVFGCGFSNETCSDTLILLYCLSWAGGKGCEDVARCVAVGKDSFLFLVGS